MVKNTPVKRKHLAPKLEGPGRNFVFFSFWADASRIATAILTETYQVSTPNGWDLKDQTHKAGRVVIQWDPFLEVSNDTKMYGPQFEGFLLIVHCLG